MPILSYQWQVLVLCGWINALAAQHGLGRGGTKGSCVLEDGPALARGGFLGERGENSAIFCKYSRLRTHIQVLIDY
ncbi:hypothetical protein BJX66DRAFT_253747 [Aspergillus keveii]|uniref:Secreted protein n=1 Tax=Aspergillus keveii TaxID=714993 RepID=A0ABR4FZA2_9EURO